MGWSGGGRGRDGRWFGGRGPGTLDGRGPGSLGEGGNYPEGWEGLGSHNSAGMIAAILGRG